MSNFFLKTTFLGGLLWFIGFTVYLAFVPWSQKDFPKSDVAIVFTGGNNRIFLGLELLEKEALQKLYISGVKKGTRLEDILKQYSFQKIDTSKIILGEEATNTLGNIKETLKWQKQDGVNNLVIITSNFHIPRVKCISSFKGLKNVVFYPVFSQNRVFSIKRLHIYIREYHKTLYFLLKELP
ncbi:MAG TPA: YdcF family protein [Alphaproteobacteria bacterium]|nr:YdcF family protein [Alphaproteobacteria bacterium]